MGCCGCWLRVPGTGMGGAVGIGVGGLLMMERYQNLRNELRQLAQQRRTRERKATHMRFEMRTCSYSGRLGFASLMCERR